MKSVVRIAIVFLLGCVLGWAQMPASSGAVESRPPAAENAPAAAPDAAFTELLAGLQSSVQQADSDLSRLRVEKWKTDGGSKQQAQDNATAIHRNLVNAIPELLQQVRSDPGSVAANFRLYRDLNAVFEAFSSLTESAGAFGPTEQYSPLAADLAQLDQLRHQFAERLDRLAGASDAELIRLRAHLAPAAQPASAKPLPNRIVVDDNKPVARKVKKKAVHKAPPPKP